MKKIILDLCGGTGSWSKPYKDAGYDVRVITLPDYDILQTEIHEDHLVFQGDWRKGKGVARMMVRYEDIYGILAAPPCTQFSFARTTAPTPRDFTGAMRLVGRCLEIIWFARAKKRLAFWALENPQGLLRQFLGRPAFSFQPYEFGDRYSKQTDIWGYFKEPKKKPVVLTEKEIWQSKVNARPLPKLPEEYQPVVEDRRQARRAMTPQGFALSFYKSNK